MGARDYRSRQRGRYQNRKRATRIFQALTDDPTTGANEVRNDPRLPSYRDIWEVTKNGAVTVQDPEMFCVFKVAAQTDPEDHRNWLVRVEYVGRGSPLLEPPDVEWGEEKYQETTQRDINGILVANSVGTPFEAGLTRDRTRMTLVIRRNVLVWDPDDRAQYVDTVNAVPFLALRHPPGFGFGIAKIDSITAKPVYYENWPDSTDIHYWVETIKVSIDKRGWDAQYLDHGFEAFVRDGAGAVKLTKPGGPPETTSIKNDGGQERVPKPLDGNGNWKPFNAPEVYLTFTRYAPVDWTPLGIEY